MQHSPLGGSAAHRFMHCPGSITLGAGAEEQETSHYAQRGTAAHNVAAHALEAGNDAWEYVGHTCPETGLTVDQDITDAVQIYLDAMRERAGDATMLIEHPFQCPDLHPLYQGTVDCGWFEDRTVHVYDYKNGAGVIVEARNNPQCLYYACGLLEHLDAWEDVDKVVVGIVQPNAPHAFGHVRTWEITVSDLMKWLDDELLPAMHTATESDMTNAGEWCRFCPAAGKACPAMLEIVVEMEVLMEKAMRQGVAALSNAELVRVLDLGHVFRIHHTAAQKVALAKLEGGAKLKGWKLVKGRGNRVWKEGAADLAEKEFGEDAFTDPSLKSPAQIDKLPKGKAFTTRQAYTPDTKMTLAPVSDSRTEQKGSKSRAKMFDPVDACGTKTRITAEDRKKGKVHE